MPRMPVTTCQVSTSATATWWFSIIMQTEYVSALQRYISPIFYIVKESDPQTPWMECGAKQKDICDDRHVCEGHWSSSSLDHSWVHPSVFFSPHQSFGEFQLLEWAVDSWIWLNPQSYRKPVRFFNIFVSFQAFQKMDTKKKEEQLKLLKEKYGINTDPPK